MKIYIYLTILFGLLTLISPAVCACECLPDRSPRQELKISKAVFVGTVVEADVDGRNGFFRFRVERTWKGGSAQFITVSGGYGTCSRAFRIGETYLVYALEEGSDLQSNICMRTTLLKDATKDIKELGKGHIIKKRPMERGVTPPNNSFNRSANQRIFYREVESTDVECAPG